MTSHDQSNDTRNGRSLTGSHGVIQNESTNDETGDSPPLIPSEIQADSDTIEPASFQRVDTSGTRRRFIFRPLRLVVGSVFLLLGLAALFMFTARAVKFNITPEPETITITSGFFNWRLGERFLMQPGDYTIRAKATGYRDLITDIVVGDAPDQDFNFQMQKLPGILMVESQPVEDVEVFVDQKHYGNTPQRIDNIEPGLHDVLFKTERYLDFLTEIEIEGKRVEQSLVAELSPAWADVSVSSQPTAAEVMIDGDVLGESPATFEVLQGTHTIGIRKPGYKLWQSELVVTAGDTVTLETVELIKADGKVSINTTPNGVNVTIAERYHGQTPLSVTLSPGRSYEVLLSRAGFEPLERMIRVEPGEDLALNLKLKPVTGVVRLQIEPEGSELLVDGQPVELTSRRLILTATRHTIEVSKTGYATYSTTVTPRPGLTQQLLINLRTDEQARSDAISDILVPMEEVTVKLIIPDRLELGASRREPGRRSNEVQKDIMLTRAFYLGIHEITNKAFREYDPSHESGTLGRALLGNDDRPVVNISWEQAVRFCNWLSERNDLPVAYHQVKGLWQLVQPVNTGYRLPSEAEWAWAARYDKGSPQRFPWGENMPPAANSGNYADESAINMVSYHVAGYNDTFRGTAPAGSFPANNFGIHDLDGNVSEWINDYYGVNPESGLLTDPFGPETGDYHVIRGSNYTSGRFSELRWTFRDYGIEPRPDTGFRIARYVE